MKFIGDVQLPRSLSDFLKSRDMDSLHTIDLPNANKTKDSEIISIADKENRVVITKDSDFLESYFIKSCPKKLILVSTGNIPNRKLLEMFDRNFSVLTDMLSRSNLVEINMTEIIEHE